MNKEKRLSRSKNEIDFYGKAPLPKQSTIALPGTEAKIKVLIERCEREETLWHPNDNVKDGGKEKEIIREFNIINNIFPLLEKEKKLSLARNKVSDGLVSGKLK